MMVKHKLPDIIRERFLPHRKQNLIYDPIISSQLYHATYRNFPTVVKKESIKLISKLGWTGAETARFRLKLASLIILSTILLPQSIVTEAQEPQITNQVTSASSEARVTNPVEVTQTVTAETYVPKKSATIPKTVTKKAVANVVPNDTPVSTNSYNWPIRGSITTRFSSYHKGIDILQPSGTPIKPLNSGKVIFAGWTVGWGNNVVIDHGNGISARYAHMSKIISKVGDSIEAGTTIGLIGQTGWATAPHLHLEVYRNNIAIDPFKVLPQ